MAIIIMEDPPPRKDGGPATFANVDFHPRMTPGSGGGGGGDCIVIQVVDQHVSDVAER